MARMKELSETPNYKELRRRIHDQWMEFEASLRTILEKDYYEDVVDQTVVVTREWIEKGILDESRMPPSLLARYLAELIQFNFQRGDWRAPLFGLGGFITPVGLAFRKDASAPFSFDVKGRRFVWKDVVILPKGFINHGGRTSSGWLRMTQWKKRWPDGINGSVSVSEMAIRKLHLRDEDAFKDLIIRTVQDGFDVFYEGKSCGNYFLLPAGQGQNKIVVMVILDAGGKIVDAMPMSYYAYQRNMFSSYTGTEDMRVGADVVARIYTALQERGFMVFYDHQEMEFYTVKPGNSDVFVWDISFKECAKIAGKAEEVFERFQQDSGRFAEVTVTENGLAFNDDPVVRDLKETDISDLQDSDRGGKNSGRASSPLNSGGQPYPAAWLETETDENARFYLFKGYTPEEFEDLRTGVKMVNGWIKERKRPGEADILKLHETVAARIFWHEERGALIHIKRGAYRDNVAGDVSNPFEIPHMYPDPKRIPSRMRKFFRWFSREFSRMETERGGGENKAVVFAAQVFYRFVKTHPFQDGNGRTGRLLMNYILKEHGLQPFVLTDSNEREYYAVTRRMKKEREFIDFLASQTKAASSPVKESRWKKYATERLETLVFGRNSFSYRQPRGPIYTQRQRKGRHDLRRDSPNGSLVAATYNIKFSEEIERAIEVIRKSGADVIALQEMDLKGVREMAGALGYDYVYAPSFFHSGIDKDLGNAILSRYPIDDYKKIILPSAPGRKIGQTAVFAAISVDHEKIGIVGTHLDVFPDVHGKAIQIERVIRSLPSSLRHLVVAGDFNTFFKREYKAVAHSFENAGMLSATGGVRWSYEYPLGIKRLLDQIWIKGMDAGGSGRIEDGAASDHLLIWAKVKISSSPVGASSPVHPIAGASRGRDENGAEGVRNHIEFAKMQLKKMLREFMAREEPRRISSTALRHIYLLVDITLERMAGRLGLSGRQKEQLKSELELSLFGEFIKIKRRIQGPKILREEVEGLGTMRTFDDKGRVYKVKVFIPGLERLSTVVIEAVKRAPYERGKHPFIDIDIIWDEANERNIIHLNYINTEESGFGAKGIAKGLIGLIGCVAPPESIFTFETAAPAELSHIVNFIGFTQILPQDDPLVANNRYKFGFIKPRPIPPMAGGSQGNSGRWVGEWAKELRLRDEETWDNLDRLFEETVAGMTREGAESIPDETRTVLKASVHPLETALAYYEEDILRTKERTAWTHLVRGRFMLAPAVLSLLTEAGYFEARRHAASSSPVEDGNGDDSKGKPSSLYGASPVKNRIILKVTFRILDQYKGRVNRVLLSVRQWVKDHKPFVAFAAAGISAWLIDQGTKLWVMSLTPPDALQDILRQVYPLKTLLLSPGFDQSIFGPILHHIAGSWYVQAAVHVVPSLEPLMIHAAMLLLLWIYRYRLITSPLIGGGLGFLIGGSLSNLTSLVYMGGVLDWLAYAVPVSGLNVSLAVLNVADITQLLGMLVLLWGTYHQLRQPEDSLKPDKPLAPRQVLAVALSISLLAHAAVFSDGFAGLRRQMSSVVQLVSLPFMKSSQVPVLDEAFNRGTRLYGRSKFDFGFLRLEGELVSKTKPVNGHYLNYGDLLRPDLFRYPPKGYAFRLVGGQPLYARTYPQNRDHGLSYDFKLLAYGHIDADASRWSAQWIMANWQNVSIKNRDLWKEWSRLFYDQEEVARAARALLEIAVAAAKWPPTVEYLDEEAWRVKFWEKASVPPGTPDSLAVIAAQIEVMKEAVKAQPIQLIKTPPPVIEVSLVDDLSVPNLSGPANVEAVSPRLPKENFVVPELVVEIPETMVSSQEIVDQARRRLLELLDGQLDLLRSMVERQEKGSSPVSHFDALMRYLRIDSAPSAYPFAMLLLAMSKSRSIEEVGNRRHIVLIGAEPEELPRDLERKLSAARISVVNPEFTTHTEGRVHYIGDIIQNVGIYGIPPADFSSGLFNEEFRPFIHGRGSYKDIYVDMLSAVKKIAAADAELLIAAGIEVNPDLEAAFVETFGWKARNIGPAGTYFYYRSVFAETALSPGKVSSPVKRKNKDDVLSREAVDDLFRLLKVFRRKGLSSKPAIAAMLLDWRRKGGKFSDEKFDVIRIKRGQEIAAGTLNASLAHYLSFRHRSVDALVVLPDGKLLVQRRTHDASSEPLHMSIPGGHVKAGAGYAGAIGEELKEELNLRTKKPHGRLVILRHEGAFFWNRKGNREVRTFYVYFPTMRESQVIAQYGRYLERKKSRMTREQFQSWLEETRRNRPGYAEVWAQYAVDIHGLTAAPSLKIKDVFADGAKEEEAYFTKDTLGPALRDAALMREIEKVIDENTKTGDVIMAHLQLLAAGSEAEYRAAEKVLDEVLSRHGKAAIAGAVRELGRYHKGRLPPRLKEWLDGNDGGAQENSGLPADASSPLADSLQSLASGLKRAFVIFLVAVLPAFFFAQSSSAAQPLPLRWQLVFSLPYGSRGPPWSLPPPAPAAGFSVFPAGMLTPFGTATKFTLSGVEVLKTGREYPRYGMFGMTVENDWFDGYDFKGGDRYYTSGLGLTWVSPWSDAPEGSLFSHLTQLLRLEGPGYRYYTDFSIHQSIYTPADTNSKQAAGNDHPYAGLLYLEQAYHAAGPRSDWKHSLIADLGLAGPYAFGRDVQNGFHGLIGYRSYGWGNQIHNEPILLLSYAGERRMWKRRYGTFGADVFAHGGAGAGNFRTYTNAGAELQFGWNLGDKSANFLNRPGRGTLAPLPYEEDARRRNQVYFFVIADGELVFYDITLDGNTLKDGARVEKNPGVARVIYGMGINFKKNLIFTEGVNLKAAFVRETERFKYQKGPHSYVSLKVEIPFRASKSFTADGLMAALRKLFSPSGNGEPPSQHIPEPPNQEQSPAAFTQKPSGSSPVVHGVRYVFRVKNGERDLHVALVTNEELIPGYKDAYRLNNVALFGITRPRLLREAVSGRMGENALPRLLSSEGAAFIGGLVYQYRNLNQEKTGRLVLSLLNEYHYDLLYASSPASSPVLKRYIGFVNRVLSGLNWFLHPSFPQRQARYDAVFEKVRRFALERREITERDIIGWQEELLDPDEVLWNIINGSIGDSREDYAGYRKKVFGVPDRRHPAPEEVPAAMTQYVRRLNNQMKRLARNTDSSARKQEAIHAAAKAHYRFIDIHPFADGNGRMARLLANYVLLFYGAGSFTLRMEGYRNYREMAVSVDSLTWWIAASLLREKRGRNGSGFRPRGSTAARAKIIRDIAEFLRGNRNGQAIVVIEGVTGSGKTPLAADLLKALRADGEIRKRLALLEGDVLDKRRMSVFLRGRYDEELKDAVGRALRRGRTMIVLEGRNSAMAFRRIHRDFPSLKVFVHEMPGAPYEVESSVLPAGGGDPSSSPVGVPAWVGEIDSRYRLTQAWYALYLRGTQGRLPVSPEGLIEAADIGCGRFSYALPMKLVLDKLGYAIVAVKKTSSPLRFSSSPVIDRKDGVEESGQGAVSLRERIAQQDGQRGFEEWAFLVVALVTFGGFVSSLISWLVLKNGILVELGLIASLVGAVAWGVAIIVRWATVSIPVHIRNFRGLYKTIRFPGKSIKRAVWILKGEQGRILDICGQGWAGDFVNGFRETAAGLPYRIKSGVSSMVRGVRSLKGMFNENRQRRGFGETVSFVIGLSAMSAFGGLLATILSGAMKSGTLMSLALTVAIVGAGIWVAAVIVRAVVHAVHGVIAYSKGFRNRAEKDTAASKDNPAFVRLGTILKLGGVSLAVAAVPLVPAVVSLAGGLLSGLGMLVGKDIFKTVPVFLAALRNREELAAAAAEAKTILGERYADAVTRVSDKTFVPSLILIVSVYAGLAAVFAAGYLVIAVKVGLSRGARSLLRRPEMKEKYLKAFEAGIFSPSAKRASEESGSKPMEKGKPRSSSPVRFGMVGPVRFNRRVFLKWAGAAVALGLLSPQHLLALGLSRKEQEGIIREFLTFARGHFISETAHVWNLEKEMVAAFVLEEWHNTRTREGILRGLLKRVTTFLTAEGLYHGTIGIARIQPNILLADVKFWEAVEGYGRKMEGMLSEREKEIWVSSRGVLKEIKEISPEFRKGYLHTENNRRMLTRLLEAEAFNIFGAGFIIRQKAGLIRRGELKKRGNHKTLAGHSKDWPEDFRVKVADAYTGAKVSHRGKDKVAWYKIIQEAWAKQRGSGAQGIGLTKILPSFVHVKPGDRCSSSPVTAIERRNSGKDIVLVQTGIIWAGLNLVDPLHLLFDISPRFDELLKVIGRAWRYIKALWFESDFYKIWEKMLLKPRKRIRDLIVFNVPKALKEGSMIKVQGAGYGVQRKIARAASSPAGAVVHASVEAKGSPLEQDWYRFYTNKLDPLTPNHEKYFPWFVANFMDPDKADWQEFRQQVEADSSSPWQVVLAKAKGGDTGDRQ
ncbi:MAG: DUF2219 family protein [Candidatus Omnitrophica bacterium]|nr:DUF2219 family protein [Candidatus Omnitrophota bacterium]